MIHRVEKIAVLFGKVPGCAWARERFWAYYAWDPSLSTRAFLAIEQHLIDCPECAAEYRAVREAMGAIERTLVADDPRLMSTEELLERTMARIGAAEAQKAVSIRRRPVFRKRAAWMAAAVCLLVVAVPALAFVGVKVLRALQPTAPTREDVKAAHVQGNSAATTAPKGALALPDASAPAGDNGVQFHGICSVNVDDQLQHAAEYILVEAMLPHTEEEYEAWARKEYPHIMALYDILIGKGLPGADGPADSETVEQRFASLVPADLPADVRDSLLKIAKYAALHGEPLWDGIPRNIPDWARRLYASIPEDERPDGWRALLIYSGEIFTFGWPSDINAPTCVPTIEALVCANKIALDSSFAVNGNIQEVRSRFPLDSGNNPARMTFHVLQPLFQEDPDEYAAALMKQLGLRREVLVHFIVAAHVVHTNDFAELAEQAKHLCACIGKDESCLFDAIHQDLTSLLEKRCLLVKRILLEYERN